MLRLNKLGIPVWFDMERLSPGTDWRHFIDEGLESCSALVLVASRAALTSDYVRREWQTALAAKKPVYVVLFEAVHLPPELQGLVLIDMRADFENKMAVLGEAIQHGKIHRDRLPWVNPFYLPTRFPLDMHFIMAALWLFTMLGLAFTVVLVQVFVSIIRPNAMDLSDCIVSLSGIALHGAPRYIYPLLSVSAAVLLVTVLAIFLDIALLYRWYFPYAILYLVLFSPALFLPSALYLQGATTPIAENITNFGIAPLSVGNESNYFMSAFGLLLFISFWLALLGLGTFFVARRSAALLRWLPTGTSPESLRIFANDTWVNRTRKRTGSLVQEKAKSWFLLYDAAEGLTAQEVKTILHEQKYLREGTAAHADVYIALLTNRTKKDWLEVLARTIPNLVCINCTSIRIPGTVEHLRQNQWFDYRERSSDKIRALADHLCEDVQGLSRYMFPSIPEGLERTKVPQPIWYRVHALWLVATFSMALIFYGGVVPTRVDSMPPAVEIDFATLAPVLYYLGLVASLYLFWITGRLMLCNISYKDFRWRQNLAMLGIIIAQIQFLGYFTQASDLIFLEGLMTVTLLVVWRVPDPTLFQAWLPARSIPLVRRNRTLAVPAWQQLWLPVVVYVFLFVVFLFLSRLFFGATVNSPCTL